MKLDISWYINSCCSNKCVLTASSLIVSSLLNSGEARAPSDPLSELLSKKDKFMVYEDVSLDIILLEDEPVPEKRQCYFLVSLLYLLVNALLSWFYSTQLTFVVAAKTMWYAI